MLFAICIFYYLLCDIHYLHFDIYYLLCDIYISNIMSSSNSIFRLIVGSGFDSNFWNRLDSTIPILEIDSNVDFFEIESN